MAGESLISDLYSMERPESPSKLRTSIEGLMASGFPVSLYVRLLSADTLHCFGSAEFVIYNPHMANPNPLAGVVPQVVHPVNDGETTVSQYVEKIEGEVALDSYVKAQTSAPEVVKRITELENCLQHLANAALASSDIEEHPELRAAAEEAKLILKNRLEVDDTRHRFHSELGKIKDNKEPFKDELRMTED